MSFLLITLLIITDTTGATSQVVAENIDLESNEKGAGKIYRHLIKLFASACMIPILSG